MTIAAAMFLSILRRKRAMSWVLAAVCVLLVALPLLLWLDYLRSIYRSLAIAGAGHITAPFAGLWPKVRMTATGWAGVPTYATVASTMALIGVAAQSWIVLGALAARPTKDAARRWALATAPFVLLAIVSHEVVWVGSPGAFTRVLLPLSIGANVVLAQRAGGWTWLAAANLQLVPGVLLFAGGWA
jgi:hypothetical protein